VGHRWRATTIITTTALWSSTELLLLCLWHHSLITAVECYIRHVIAAYSMLLEAGSYSNPFKQPSCFRRCVG
jgi:hypothetical protein